MSKTTSPNASSNGQSMVRQQCDIEPHVGRRLEDVERDLIIGTLARCGGNRTWASDILGISVRTLRNKMIQYGKDEAAPAKAGRRSRSQEEAHLALLEEFQPLNRIPS